MVPWSPEAWFAAVGVVLASCGAAIGYLVRIERLLTKLVADADNFRRSHTELWEQHNELKEVVSRNSERIAVLESHVHPAH